jgi:hypothetical protein
MKILLFVDQKTEVDSAWQRLKTDLEQRHLAISRFDLKTANAQAQAKLYDVTSAGTVVVTRDDGAPVASWRAHLPSADEISHSLGYI